MADPLEYGFAMPSGDDYILNGDNVIRQNAQAAADGLEKVEWDKTIIPLLSTANIYGLAPGIYTPISTSAATTMGLPTANVGKLEMVATSSNSRVLTWTPASSLPRFFTNRRVGATNWTGWEEFTPSGKTQAGSVEREMRVAQARARWGGRYGTNGVAVLSLAFDHGTNNFVSKILPILREAGVPATLGLNSQMYAAGYQFASSDNLTSFTQLQTMALTDGITLWNHGRLHNGGGETEIVGGRDELQAALPRIPIESWLHTGAYGDFESGSTFAKYWENTIGSTILNSHAFATGDIQEPIKPLTGEMKPGYDGEWIDTGAPRIAYVKALVQAAQKVGGAVMTRHHPMYLDTPDHLTSAQLREFILWAAAERDAGRLIIMTADLMNLADASSDRKRNLTDGKGGAGNQSRTISLDENLLALGSVNEVHATVKLATAGSVKLTALATALTASRTITVPANKWVDLHQFFTIPRDITGNLTVKVDLVTGTGLTVHQLNVYPG